MKEREALTLALDKKAENARELGLDYEHENTLHWHALNYRTAPTQNAQKMFEALEKFVETAIKEALAQPELCKYGQEPKSCTSSPMDCQCAIDATLAQPEQFWHHNCPDSGETATEKGKPCNWCDAVEAQPEQEPVAWMEKDVLPLTHIIKAVVRREKDETYTEPLYTTPPQRKPLTDFDEWYKTAIWGNEDFKQGCRRAWDAAIEASHGIKEKNT